MQPPTRCKSKSDSARDEEEGKLTSQEAYAHSSFRCEIILEILLPHPVPKGAPQTPNKKLFQPQSRTPRLPNSKTPNEKALQTYSRAPRNRKNTPRNTALLLSSIAPTRATPRPPLVVKVLDALKVIYTVQDLMQAEELARQSPCRMTGSPSSAARHWKPLVT